MFGHKLSNAEYANFHLLRKNASSMDLCQRSKFDKIIKDQTAAWEGKEIAVLSLGSGVGDFDLEIIQSIKDNNLAIKKYVCVEPISENIEPLKLNLRRVLPEEQFEVIESLFETCEFSHPFDFIHNVHVIHWMQDPISALKKMDGLLEKKGLSVSVLQSERGIPRVYEMLNASMKDSLTAEALMAMTKAVGLNYQLDYVSAHLDVTSIINQEELGRKILQFMISSRLNQEQFEESIPLIKSLTKEENGKFLIEEPFAFIVSKAANSN